jgi:putative transposase
LTEVLREGARELLAMALRVEVAEFIEAHKERLTEDGLPAVVRNGYHKERTIQTGRGAVEVKVPRTRDRSGEGLVYKSVCVPKYLRKTRHIEDFIPLLYLKGVSSNDMQEALGALVGVENAHGYSSSTVSRLKSEWESECQAWQKRQITTKYVYLWADGIYCRIRSEDEKQCILVIVGVTENGKKELLALDDGYRESTESWAILLRTLKQRGLAPASLAVGDGALGFWTALRDVFPETRHQRCWHHKMMNVLSALPKALVPKVASDLKDIYLAETSEMAEKAFSLFCATYNDKYPKAVLSLTKDKDKLFTFHSFPAAHWKSLRTTNPIESTFATVRQRSAQAKGCVSRNSMLAFIYKLIKAAEARWHRLPKPHHLAEVIKGVQFKDGLSVDNAINTEVPTQKDRAA